MRYYADNAKDEIIGRLDIKNVVERYANVEFNIHNRGACPLHGGKNYNFTIYQSSKSFFCFSCGAGGDLIKFVSLYFNISYLEAMRKLNEDYCLDLLKKSHKSYNAKIKEAMKLQSQINTKETLKRSQKHDYNLLINYFKWLQKQPKTVKSDHDLLYIERLLDKHLDLERNPIDFDVKARIKALHSKFIK